MSGEADVAENQVVISALNTYEVMRILEDVLSNSAFAPDEHLRQLEAFLANRGGKGVGGSYSAALRKLEEVRLASARNLARAMVLNINEF